MGTADFDMSMTLRGTADEITVMLKEFKRYCGRDTEAYFSMPSAEIGDEHVVLDPDDEEFESMLEKAQGELTVSAAGPYGKYFELNDVDVFRDMAKAAPNASFEAGIEGFTSYTEQKLDCELKDGILHISTFFMSNEEGPEAYIEYFMELLPFDDFVEMFEVDTTDFDEDSYREFIACCVIFNEGGLLDMDYEEFCGEMEDCAGVDETGYEAALERYAELEIMSFEQFEDDADFGDRFEYEYDPVAGEYIGKAKAKPMVKPGVAYEINDDIRAYLEQNGLPCDDAAIAALSVEEVYEILAGTYGNKSAETAPAEAEPATEPAPVEAEPVVEPAPVEEEPAVEPAPVEAEPAAETAPVEEEPAAEPAPVEAEPAVEPAPVEEEPAVEPAHAEAEPAAETAPVEAEPAAEPASAGAEQPKKRSKAWIVWLIVAVVAAAIAAAAVFCPFVSELMETALASIITLFE